MRPGVLGERCKLPVLASIDHGKDCEETPEDVEEQDTSLAAKSLDSSTPNFVVGRRGSCHSSADALIAFVALEVAPAVRIRERQEESTRGQTQRDAHTHTLGGSCCQPAVNLLQPADL